jgi:hypothetical protein
MSESYDSALLPAARAEARKKGPQCRVLFIGCGPSALRQNTAEPVIAAIDPPRLAYPGTLMVTGTNACP